MGEASRQNCDLGEQPLSCPPVYLHFLDRELLTGLGLYKSLSARNVFDDLNILLLSEYEPCYLSISLVLENKFANELFKKFTGLFRRGHIEIALAAQNLEEEIREKRDQYPHAIQEYPFYFDHTWRQIEAAAPFYRERNLDTSSILEEALIKYFEGVIRSQASQFEGIRQELLRLLPYAIEALKERRGLAVTRLLFEDAVRYREITPAFRRFLALAISEQYVMSYLLEYDGTIATGLIGGLDHFHYLCPTFPLHHVSLWRESYLRLGCLRLIRSFDANTIVYVRESAAFQTFVDTIRLFISNSVSRWLSQSFSTQTMRPKRDLINYLERRIRGVVKPPWKAPTEARAFLSTLETVTNALCQTRERELNVPKFYFPAEWRMREMNDRDVFVVYGRDVAVRKALFELLRAANLNPKEFAEIIHDSGSGTPFVGEAIDLALSRARAIVVILTGDDLAFLKPELRNEVELEEDPTPQPRPNVLFEAGLALAKAPNRTVLVQVGNIREISDLAGRHIVRLRDNTETRKDLLLRLHRAGCDVRLDGNDWMTAGTLPS